MKIIITLILSIAISLEVSATTGLGTKPSAFDESDVLTSASRSICEKFYAKGKFSFSTDRFGVSKLNNSNKEKLANALSSVFEQVEFDELSKAMTVSSLKVKQSESNTYVKHCLSEVSQHLKIL